MLRQNKLTLVLTSLLILSPIAAGLILWQRLPETIAIHWNAAGAADGYSGKAFAVLAMPLILFAIHWVCVLVTHFSLRGADHSKKPITLVLWIIPCICITVQSFVLCSALGYEFDITLWLCLLLGVMFMAIGNYLPKCKQNRVIGIKIKWTLQSEENWNATHRFGGKVWFLGGICFFLCLLFPTHLRFIPVMCILAVLILLPLIYSYRFHKRNP